MFKRTKQRLYQFIVKIKLSDIPAAWQNRVDSVLLRQEQEVFERQILIPRFLLTSINRIRISSLLKSGSASSI